MSEVFKVELDFQDGNGWVDITSITRAKEFYRERHLYNNLNPTVDICRFKIQYDQLVLSNLLLTQDNIKARIRRGAGLEDYFYGYVNPDYKIKSSTRVDWIEIRLVDNAFLLDSPVTKVLQYAGVKLADYTDTSNSLVHKILNDAGFNWDDVGDIQAFDSTGSNLIEISYFTHLPTAPSRDNKAMSQIPYGGSYEEVLTNLLFQHGFTYYFDESGDFQIFDFRNTNVNPGSNVFNNSNMIGTFNFQKKSPRYEAAEITWQDEETITDLTIFRDTEGTDNAIYPNGNIRVGPGDFYPRNATDSFIPEGYFNPVFEDGRSAEDIIAVYNPQIETEYYGEDVVTTETKTRTEEFTYTSQEPVYGWKLNKQWTECHDPFKSIVTAVQGLFVNNTKYLNITHVGGCWTGCFNRSKLTRFGFGDWRWVTVTSCPIPGFKFRFDEYVYTVTGYTTVEHTGGEEVEYEETIEEYFDPAYTQSFEALPLSFKLRIKNTGTHDLYIRRLQIKGDVRLKGVPTITKDQRSGETEKVFRYDAGYIHDSDSAMGLANAVYDYFNNSTYSYILKSDTLYEPGTWVQLTDENFENVSGFPVENKRCLIVSRKDEEFTGTHYYTLEEYADYVA